MTDQLCMKGKNIIAIIIYDMLISREIDDESWLNYTYQ